MKKVFFLNAGFSLILFVIGLFIVNQKFDSLTTTSNLSTDSNSSLDSSYVPDGMGKPVSDQNYQKITKGMTMDQVDKILGRKGAKVFKDSESEGVVNATRIWKWRDKTKEYTIIVMYDNGKLTFKNKSSEALNQ